MMGKNETIKNFLVLALVGLMNASAASAQNFSKNQHTIDKDTWYISHGWANGAHQSCEWRKHEVSYDDGMLVLGLSERGGKHRPYGCAEIRTNKKYGYGRYEARMKTAAGSGLNTAFFTFIGKETGGTEHDEIDFEFLGKSPDIVEVTHYRNSKQYKITKVDLGYDSSKEFHNYAIDWTSESIKWYVDDKLVYETPKGTVIPVHKQQIFFSLWSSSPDLNDWMGKFKYKGPYAAAIEWVKFEEY